MFFLVYFSILIDILPRLISGIFPNMFGSWIMLGKKKEKDIERNIKFFSYFIMDENLKTNKESISFLFRDFNKCFFSYFIFYKDIKI